MVLIDGKKVSQEIKDELKIKIDSAKNKLGLVPGLVTIIVGENPASQIYVKMKNKACAEIGMYSEKCELDSKISEAELLEIIEKYNNDEKINGILVQLPLPNHIDENKVIEKISPSKDVDGFHPVSVGNLVIGKETFLSCTPYGIWELLKRYKISFIPFWWMEVLTVKNKLLDGLKSITTFFGIFNKILWELSTL